MPSKKVAWLEGHAEAKDIVGAITDAIVGATLPDSEVNKWVKAFSEPEMLWVEYTRSVGATSVLAVYKHTDGNSYPVYKVSTLPSGEQAGLIDAEGYVKEIQEPPVPSNLTQTPTGKKIKVHNVTYTNINTTQEVTLESIEDSFVCMITEEGVTKVYVMEQGFVGESEFTPDAFWNNWRIVGELTPAATGDWADFVGKSLLYKHDYVYNSYISSYVHNDYKVNISSQQIAVKLFTPAVKSFDQVVVLKSTPSVPAETTPQDFFVMFTKPVGQQNYFDVRQGEGFEGTAHVGDPVNTYTGICDPLTVKKGAVPTVVDYDAAYAYVLAADPTVFTPPVLEWAKDWDGVSEIISPPAHFFFGADSSVDYLTNKKRRPDYWVYYYISINNDHIAMICEGDPAPDMTGFYRSFGYIGKIIPFSQYDHRNNFGITVGMGDLAVNRTGFVWDNINPQKNADYMKFGPYSSNGMTSMSMLRTYGNVMFQAHYPALLSHLPEYTGTGTLPAELQKLVLDKDGFQASKWTGKYHASPIYMFHQVEGYRGQLDGVIAVSDHNIVNLDELIVDTEEAKDGGGTWQETYKFFSIKTPVNFLKYSANPTDMTIAILKEVK